MGRSAKFAKRPTKKEKIASSTAKQARKPLPPPPPPPPEPVEEGEKKVQHKRKMLRAKVEKVRLLLPR